MLTALSSFVLFSFYSDAVPPAGNPRRSSGLPQSDLPDPNSFKLGAIEKWLPFYDIYQKHTFPHLVEFDSWEHALELLQTTDLADVSHNMQRHNAVEFHRIGSLWQRLFKGISGDPPVRDADLSINVALKEMYGVALYMPTHAPSVQIFFMRLDRVGSSSRELQSTTTTSNARQLRRCTRFDSFEELCVRGLV